MHSRTDARFLPAQGNTQGIPVVLFADGIANLNAILEELTAGPPT